MHSSVTEIRANDLSLRRTVRNRTELVFMLLLLSEPEHRARKTQFPCCPLPIRLRLGAFLFCHGHSRRRRRRRRGDR